MSNIDKLTVFSAIQPSSKLTIANYIGTLMHWSAMQNNYKCFYCIADLHCLTTHKNIICLKKSVLDTLAIYLSCGIDPNKSVVFVQSHVYEHCQLHWFISCYTYFGELSRMTQFKTKSVHNSNNIGLFNYPILMASDILLYQSNEVPIGKDQIQHLELTKKIAIRLNSIYGKLFNIPSFILPKIGSKIFSLQDPTKKMSKSDFNENNSIFLLDDIKSIVDKIKKSITDSDNPPKIYYDSVHKPGISNLLCILSVMTNKKISELEIECLNMKYVDFKNLVANIVSEKLKVLQKSYLMYRQDESYLYKVIQDGAEKARIVAQSTVKRVKNVLNYI